jgi:glycosyltransferase involved in cell wall biosynthesis
VIDAMKPITIILPVYGLIPHLKPALDSVLELEQRSWELLIADNGLHPNSKELLQTWLAERGDEQITWSRRTENLGLFGSLNQAICEAKNEWIAILCSDDRLLPGAISRIQQLRERWSEPSLIISTFVSINADGSARPANSAWHHDQVSPTTAVVPPNRFVPALLQLGSLNGNLSGMAFSRTLWRQAGPFRTDWRHAADWEWLLRAAVLGPLILNRTPIAQVRTHANQLSNSNRRSGHELLEVAEVVLTLRQHPLLAEEPRRHRWAAAVMQHQLWNRVKQLTSHGPGPLLEALKPIHAAAGLRRTTLALLHSAPKRLQGWLRNNEIDGAGPGC